MSNLFQLVDGDLTALVHSLQDLTSRLVRHVALLATRPESASVLVRLTELSRPLEAPTLHVRSGVLPHHLVTGSPGVPGPLRDIGGLSILPPLY